MVVACIVGLAPALHAQPLRQCVGGKAQFAVSGDSLSTFRYSIGGGVFLDSVKPDSLVVQWGMQKGQYKLGVQEVSMGGCEGQWTYMDIELVGTPFFFGKTTRRICEDEAIHVPIDPRLYKKVRWSDPDIEAKGITQPGGYRIWVEDAEGCHYTDSLTVVTCIPQADLEALRRTTQKE